MQDWRNSSASSPSPARPCLRRTIPAGESNRTGGGARTRNHAGAHTWRQLGRHARCVPDRTVNHGDSQLLTDNENVSLEDVSNVPGDLRAFTVVRRLQTSTLCTTKQSSGRPDSSTGRHYAVDIAP